MNELIRIAVNENQEQVVSARELHERLGLGRDFTNWFKYQSEKLNLIENQDFSPIMAESTGGRPSVDYHITLDIAKHISMVSGGEKAHEIRQYFIQVEKAYKQQRALSPLQILEHQLQIMKEHERKLTAIETTVDNIKEAFVTESDNWREDVNHIINKVVKAVGSNKFSEVRSESYKMLESKAGVNLKQRLANMRNRLLEEGASQTKIKNLNNMDVIEQDKKLREIYMTIVKSYYVKYCA